MRCKNKKKQKIRLPKHNFKYLMGRTDPLEIASHLTHSKCIIAQTRKNRKTKTNKQTKREQQVAEIGQQTNKQNTWKGAAKHPCKRLSVVEYAECGGRMREKMVTR